MKKKKMEMTVTELAESCFTMGWWGVDNAVS
jgi:hypothetical protein